MQSSMLQCQQLLSTVSFSPQKIPSTFHFSLSSSPSLTFLHSSISLHCLSALPRSTSEPWLAQAAEPPTATALGAEAEDGPIELPPSTPSIFATTDDPSPLQVSTSVLLTGAIGVFLFRALRRRAKRARELKFRSSGLKKTLQEEALDSLKAVAVAPASVEPSSPPSPVQALLGGITAGVIALILYKFTTTIEASLNRQTVSDNFSVRQITITIRTIINGLCYLATFVFGINSVGLLLYSGQLAINSFMEGSTREETKRNDEQQSGSPSLRENSYTNNDQLNSSEGRKSSDDSR